MINNITKKINQSFYQDLQRILEEDNYTIIQYDQSYSLRYLGEICERFNERELITNANDLITLLQFVNEYFSKCGARFSNVFQETQAEAFVENVLTWIKENDSLVQEDISILTLLYCFIIKRDGKDNKVYLQLKSIIDDAAADNYWFDILSLMEALTFFRIDKSVLPQGKELLLSLMLKNNFKVILMNYEEILSLKSLVTDKSVLKTFSLKLQDLKRNRDIYDDLNSLRRVFNGELKEFDIEKIKPNFSISTSELLLLNSSADMNSNAHIRVTILTLKYLLIERTANKDVIDLFDIDTMLKDVTEKGYGELIGLIENNINNIQDKTLLKTVISYIKENHNSYFNVSLDLMKYLFFNEDVRSAFSEKEFIDFVVSQITIGISKEHFDFLYEYLKKKGIDFFCIIRESYYKYETIIQMLIRFKYLDIADVETIKNHNLQMFVFSKFPFMEKLFYGILLQEKGVKIEPSDMSIFIKELKSKNHINLNAKFKLCDDTLNKEVKDKILGEKLTDFVFETLAEKSTHRYVDYLYDFIQDPELNVYLEMSEEDMISTKRYMYENSLVSGEDYLTLKNEFMTEEEIETEKIQTFIASIKALDVDSKPKSYWEHWLSNISDALLTTYKSLEEDEIFSVNSTILDEFYNTLNLISLKIDSGVLKDVKKAHISKLCYLSFFISNSVLPQSYKDKMCSIINEIFVKC